MAAIILYCHFTAGLFRIRYWLFFCVCVAMVTFVLVLFIFFPTGKQKN